MIAAVIAPVLVLVGAAFCLVAAVGLWRMPTLYARMHAATKAGPVGAGLVLVGVAVASSDVDHTARALAVVAFLLATAPIAAHLVGRAAHRREEDQS